MSTRRAEHPSNQVSSDVVLAGAREVFDDAIAVDREEITDLWNEARHNGSNDCQSGQRLDE